MDKLLKDGALGRLRHGFCDGGAGADLRNRSKNRTRENVLARELMRRRISASGSGLSGEHGGELL
jgi:hypothetical protein